ncbi:hypothetical protein HaLaN_27188, partial [Haematococcus lacustris]
MLTPLEYAKPSFTHMVISTLVALDQGAASSSSR